jgi:hypothetical protein
VRGAGVATMATVSFATPAFQRKDHQAKAARAAFIQLPGIVISRLRRLSGASGFGIIKVARFGNTHALSTPTEQNMRDTHFINSCALVLVVRDSVYWERFRRWHKECRDRADLAAMNDFERQDVGLPAFSAWR